MNDIVKPEIPPVDLALAPPATVSDAGSALPGASAPAALPVDAAGAAPVVEAAKPFIAAEEPTALEKFDADKAAAAVEAAKKPAAEVKAEPEKPVVAADAKPVEPAKDPAKAEVAKPDAAAAKPEDAKPAEPAKLEPVVYEYKLPDTLKMDDALKGKTHSAFDAFRADPVKGAQALVDLHNEQMQAFATDYAAQTLENQQRAFAATRRQWQNEHRADPEIGGAGYDTALEAIARVRDIAVSSAKRGTPQYDADMKSFNDFLRITGAGDHPAFLKFVHNAARFVDEPQYSSLPGDIKPAPGNGRGKRSLYSDASIEKMRST